jgi:hypothetical protein
MIRALQRLEYGFVEEACDPSLLEIFCVRPR